MENENIVHVRLVAGSTPLYDFIKELGYEPLITEGHHLDKITFFINKGKYLRVGYQGITLFYYIKEKYIEVYKGLTVHDEILKFFTKRDHNHDKLSLSDLDLLPGRKKK